MSALTPFLTFLSNQGFTSDEVQALQKLGITAPHGILEIDPRELAEDLFWSKYRAAELKGLARTFMAEQKSALQEIKAPTSGTDSATAIATAIKTVLVGEVAIADMRLLDVLKLAATPPDQDDREAVINRLQALADKQLPYYSLASIIALEDGKVSPAATLAFWGEITGTADLKLPRTYENLPLVKISSLWEVGKKLFSPTTGRQLIAGSDGPTNWNSISPDNLLTRIERLAFVVWARKNGYLLDWRDGEIVKALRKPTEDEDIAPLYADYLREIEGNMAQRQTLEYSVYRKPEPQVGGPAPTVGIKPHSEMTSRIEAPSSVYDRKKLSEALEKMQQGTTYFDEIITFNFPDAHSQIPGGPMTRPAQRASALVLWAERCGYQNLLWEAVKQKTPALLR